MNMRPQLTRQRGVAVITALLLTTLAITIVASLFWQQQVQVRSIENQRLQLQTKWILRGALDWARLILREDARLSNVDTLDEPWAVPLAETRLDEYVEKGRTNTDTTDATLSGHIIDAQSRYNLSNLAANGTVNPLEVVAFGRLLSNLRLNPALAQATAEAMASTQAKPAAARDASGAANATNTATTAPGPANAASSSRTSGAEPLGLIQADDLLSVPGFSSETLEALKDYVVVLPNGTPINVNTASAEVLAARMDTLSLADATALVASRERASFKNLADFKARLQGRALAASSGAMDDKSSYFIVYGKVRLDRASQEMQALIERKAGSAKVVWIREN